MTDLLALTASLVDIASPSHHEVELVDYLESALETIPHLDLVRVGNNLVARTELGRSQRIVLAGHTDTVPPQGNERAIIRDDILFGVGACDMKGGLAIALDLARRISDPVFDVSYVFYAREEVAGIHSGLGELFREVPDLLACDLALLGEPTSGLVEAGCQGTMRAKITMTGRRAHTSRAWMGENAIHRLGPVLQRISDYQPRKPLIDGCQFHEGLQAVTIDGGGALNVVPDSAEVLVNFRFAPDRDAAQAETEMRNLIGECDGFEVTEMAAGAKPASKEPLLAAMIEDHDLEVSAKLGWTDVARFSEHGIPAANFGPGRAELAHTSTEQISRQELQVVYDVLHGLLSGI